MSKQIPSSCQKHNEGRKSASHGFCGEAKNSSGLLNVRGRQIVSLLGSHSDSLAVFGLQHLSGLMASLRGRRSIQEMIQPSAEFS